jgi:hypothetical protein
VTTTFYSNFPHLCSLIFEGHVFVGIAQNKQEGSVEKSELSIPWIFMTTRVQQLEHTLQCTGYVIPVPNESQS